MSKFLGAAIILGMAQSFSTFAANENENENKKEFPPCKEKVTVDLRRIPPNIKDEDKLMFMVRMSIPFSEQSKKGFSSPNTLYGLGMPIMKDDMCAFSIMRNKGFLSGDRAKHFLYSTPTPEPKIEKNALPNAYVPAYEGDRFQRSFKDVSYNFHVLKCYSLSSEEGIQTNTLSA